MTNTKTDAHKTRIEPGTSASGRENLRASCACGWQGQKTFQRWRAEREAKTHHAPKTDASLEKQENQALQRAIAVIIPGESDLLLGGPLRSVGIRSTNDGYMIHKDADCVLVCREP